MTKYIFIFLSFLSVNGFSQKGLKNTTKDVCYSFFLKTDIQALYGNKYKVCNVFWSDSKIEPHPISTLQFDSLAIVLLKRTDLSIEVIVNYKLSKKLNLKRTEYIINLLKSTYNVKNNISVIKEKVNEEGLFIKFW